MEERAYIRAYATANMGRTGGGGDALCEESSRGPHVRRARSGVAAAEAIAEEGGNEIHQNGGGGAGGVGGDAARSDGAGKGCLPRYDEAAVARNGSGLADGHGWIAEEMVFQ